MTGGVVPELLRVTPVYHHFGVPLFYVQVVAQTLGA